MLDKRNKYILLIFIQFISMAAMEMSTPFWVLHLKTITQDMDSLIFMSSLVYVSPGLAIMVCAPFWGRLGDRLGHKIMILRALFALGISQFLFFLIFDPWLVILIRVLQGVFSGFITSAQAYALTGSLPEERNKLLSNMQSVTATASLIGPLFGGVIMDYYGFTTIFLVSSFLCMFCFILAFFLPAIKNFACNDKIKKIKNTKWILSIAIMILLMQSAKMIPQSFFSLYVAELFELSNFTIGLIYSSSALTIIISAPLWGKFFTSKKTQDKIYSIEIIIWFCFITMIISSYTSDWFIFTLSRIFWGIWQGALLPVAYALIIKNCNGRSYGSYLAIGNSASKAGAITGTVLGGAVINLIGIKYGFWFVAIFYALLGFFVRFLKKHTNQ